MANRRAGGGPARRLNAWLGTWQGLVGAAFFFATAGIAILELRQSDTVNGSTSAVVDGPQAQANTAAESERPNGGFGPSRPILDWNEIDERDGFDDGPHFNSYVNSDAYGDERGFLDVKSLDDPTGPFHDFIAEASGRYYVRAYVINDSQEFPETLDAMTARDVRIRFEIPYGDARAVTLQARITSSNAVVPEVYDVAGFGNDAGFSVNFVAGSAYVYSAFHPEGLRLSDDIVDEGVLLGTQELDGVVPPGFGTQMFVVIEVLLLPDS